VRYIYNDPAFIGIFFCISCSFGADIHYSVRGEIGGVVNVENGSNTNSSEDIIEKDFTTDTDIEVVKNVNYNWKQIRPIKREYIFNSDDELCK
jgi:hypothetical protein